MTVVAIDPGRTTGIAVWKPAITAGVSYAPPPDFARPEFFSAWGAPREEVLDVLEEYTQDHVADVIICERFTITARTAKLSRTGSYEALELIGVARYLAERGSVPFVLQQPADAMNFADDAKLKKLGWYTPGPDHARDATRHLVLYLVKNGLIEPSRVLH